MKNSSNSISAILTGLASGIAIGILIAPDKGAKTRQKISRKGDDYLNDIRRELSEIRKDFNKKIDATKEGMEDLTQKGKTKAKEAEEEVRENINESGMNESGM